MRNSLRTRLIVILIAMAVIPLLLVGIVAGWQGYTAQRRQALDLQRGVAQRISLQVDAFIRELENTARYTLQPWRLKDLDQNQQARILYDFLAYQDAFETMSMVDSQGREQAHVSRQDVMPLANLGDRSAADEFVIPMTTGETYYGPLWYGGSLGNEPLMTIAVPIRQPGSTQVEGVLVSDIRVRRIWNLLTTSQVDEAETVYIVDAQGNLFAHQDYALVQQGIKFVPPRQDGIYAGLNRTSVVLAVDRLQYGKQEFSVIAEKPVIVALAPALNTLVVIFGFMAVTLVIAAAVGVLAVNQIVRPIQAVAAAASEIRAGNLSMQVKVSSQDEIGGLAQAFNDMTDQLRKTLEEVRSRTDELAQRGQELEKLNVEMQGTAQKAEQRAAQLAASAQVAHAVSQVRDLDQLLAQVTQLIGETFGYYHVGIFIVDELGSFAVLRAANSDGGRRMMARNHKLAVGTQGIVGYVTGTGQPRIALDVGADAVHFDNPDLPQTRSEMALPLHVEDRIFGALDVQTDQAAAFTKEDVAVLSTLADQIAIAIENARLFTQTRTALQGAEEAQRRYLRQEWEQLVPHLPVSGHEYHVSGVLPVGNAFLPEIEQALLKGQVVTTSAAEAPVPYEAMAVPIKLADETVGVIDLQVTGAIRGWTEDDIALATAVADQVALALENARLFEQTQQRAHRERVISEIAAKMRNAPNVDGILRTTVQEIRRALGVTHGVIRLRTQEPVPAADQEAGTK